MQVNRGAVLGAILIVSGCAEPERQPIGPGPVLPTDTVRNLTVQEREEEEANRFAFDLLRETDGAETEKPNFMVSPLSVRWRWV